MILKKGFTLIELIVVIAIIAVLAASSSWIMAYTVKNSVFIPNQLNMDKLANDALNFMINGDNTFRGLRFARVVTAITANQVNFTDQNGTAIYYRWDTGTNKLYRKIGAAAEIQIPSYASNMTGVTISGKSGTMFTYYDSANVVTAVAANVRRIRIILIAQSGSGLYNDWQGQSEQATSVALKKLQ